MLTLLRLLPLETQHRAGQRLAEYLSNRMVLTPNETLLNTKGNRWYDTVDPLMESLEQMKTASHPIKLQCTDFLSRLLDVSDSHCA